MKLPFQAVTIEFKYNVTTLQDLYKLDVASKVFLAGEISYTEILASLCDNYEPDHERLLRFAMCY